MHLWVIRHGEAASLPIDEGGPPLTGAGKEAVAKLARWLEQQREVPVALYVSPLKRAQDTARILNNAWDLKPQSVDWLKPGVEPSKIFHGLEKHRQGTVALVGHLPTLGWLVSSLVWGLPPKEVVLPKASVTCLSVEKWEPSGANLRWVLNPELEL